MNKRRSPLMTQFNVRVTVGQREELRRYAWDANKSVSALVRETLESHGIIYRPTSKKALTGSTR
jgi:predicted HicB family RNase H-like nuclease